MLDLVVIGTSSAKVLADLGYTNVRDNAGGKKDWIDAGLPLVPSRRAHDVGHRGA